MYVFMFICIIHFEIISTVCTTEKTPYNLHNIICKYEKDCQGRTHVNRSKSHFCPPVQFSYYMAKIELVQKEFNNLIRYDPF